MALSKTPRSLIALQEVAANTQLVGTPLDTSTIFSGTAAVRLGRKVLTALNAGVKIRIEGAMKTSPLGWWVPLVEVQSGVAAVNATTLSAGASAGATSFAVTSATGIAYGSILTLFDGTPADSEIVRVKSISGTTVTPEEALVKAHASGIIVTNGVEIWSPLPLRLIDFTQIRAVVDNQGVNYNILVEVPLSTVDTL